MEVVTLLSGGMDSTTLAYMVDHHLSGDSQQYALSVHYGQSHNIELNAAEITAGELGLVHRKVDLSDVQDLLSSSALTDGAQGIPEGHYTEDRMRDTVVPNRNTILMSIAFGWAASLGADYVAGAMHAGDHAIYPDCRPEFLDAFDAMQFVALDSDIYESEPPELYAPFAEKSKADIVNIGESLGVPWSNTHTCYKGQRPACGRCSTCVERLEAFDAAGVTDPLPYEDRHYWEQAATQGKSIV